MIGLGSAGCFFFWSCLGLFMGLHSSGGSTGGMRSRVTSLTCLSVCYWLLVLPLSLILKWAGQGFFSLAASEQQEGKGGSCKAFGGPGPEITHWQFGIIPLVSASHRASPIQGTDRETDCVWMGGTNSRVTLRKNCAYKPGKNRRFCFFFFFVLSL